MIRTPLFGKDSLPHHTSGVLGLIGTVIFWLLLLLAGILIPVGKNKPKLKPVQIVLSPPEKTFQKTPQDFNLKKDSEGALSSMQNEADMQQSEPQVLENAADASEMPVVEMTEPVEPPVSEPVLENTAQNVPVPKAPEPVVEKTVVEKPAPEKPKKTEPAPVKKAEPKTETKPAAKKTETSPKKQEVKKIEKKAEPVQPVEEPVLVKSAEDLWAEQMSRKKTSEPVDFSKIFGDSDSVPETSSEQNNVSRKVVTKNEIEGAAGKVASKSSVTPATSVSSTASEKKDTQASSSTGSRLSAIAGTESSQQLQQIETAGQGRNLDTVKTSGTGRIDIETSDGRTLIEPSVPSISLSQDNAREITTSVTVTISFIVQPNGNVTNVTFEPESSLPAPVRNEIKSQIVFWRFDAADAPAQAKFEYTIVKR